jgi:hypothetical protein
MARELEANVNESNLNTKKVELADREKWLAERQLQELAAAQKRLEELHASWAGEAQRVRDSLRQTESALVPLGFSPLRSRLSAQEVGAVLPLFDSAGAKMS